MLIFPGPGLWPVAWVVLVPLMLLLRAAPGPREAALLGWLGGTGYLAATQYWLLPSLSFFFPLAAAVLGLLWLPWGVLVRALLHGGRTGPAGAVAALAGVPAGWVLIETVRSWQWLGGPWAVLGASQWRHPAALGLAAVGGVWLVGFALVAGNTAVVLLVTQPRAPRVAAVAAAGGVVAVAAGPVWFAAHSDPVSPGAVRVAIVQPGLYADPASRLAAGVSLTERLAGGRGGVDLVVWGESSVGSDLATDPAVRGRLIALSARVGAPLLVNVDAVRADGGIAKVSVLLDAHGVIGQYTKTRLVPFGEYIPFRGQLGWLAGMTQAAGVNREHGPGPVVLRTRAGLPIGPLVSYESTFPDMARTQADMGARLLVYQTSMSTFQNSWAPAQMASLGAVRAAETARPVVQAVLSGESAAYDARGRQLGRLEPDRRGTLMVTLHPSTARTPYERFGNYVPVACLVLVPAALLVGRRQGRPTGGR
ncbi:apolipoprotein N-acyltransferase [Streptacidiphilus griseoplanus]|uniref:apolipoprotein N-acyltransferase n=1 Tax=Peterkaempfera griseoplana TaxID=66896 RepID=UPI000B1CC0D5|nr:apolipoprotein N-acyltransferase [Peterkaempfera griseoplana]